MRTGDWVQRLVRVWSVVLAAAGVVCVVTGVLVGIGEGTYGAPWRSASTVAGPVVTGVVVGGVLVVCAAGLRRGWGPGRVGTLGAVVPIAASLTLATVPGVSGARGTGWAVVVAVAAWALTTLAAHRSPTSSAPRSQR